MNKQRRRHFSAPERVAILKRHLLEKTPVSTLCDELDIRSTQFYRWQKEFFENGHRAFDNDRQSKAEEATKDRKIEQLGLAARTTHGAQQRGPCPLHGATTGTSRCFSVNLDAHTFHCFTCGRSGNALDLWAAATGQSPYDAAVDLCQRLHIPLPVLGPPEPFRNKEEEPVPFGPETCTSP